MYDWDARDYANHSQAQADWAMELLDRLEFSGDESVLDLGCGDGKVTAAIAERAPAGRVVGVDNSGAMVELARTTYGNREPQLTFVQGEVSALNFDQAFDVVFSNACLHWIQNHAPVLTGVARALRRGGRLQFSMGGKGNASTVIETMEAVTSDKKWAGFFEGFTSPYGFHGPRRYTAWLAQAALTPVRVELVSKDMVHTPEAFAGWVRTTWIPYTQRVPETQRDRFLADVLERYREVCPPRADGCFHTPMVRLEVEARKPG